MAAKKQLLHALPPALVPFVGRALRGPRKRLYMAAALAIAGLNLILGLWIALASGPVGNEMRHALHREEALEVVEMRENVVYAFSAEEVQHGQRWLEHDFADGSYASHDIEYRVDARRYQVVQGLWSLAIDTGYNRHERMEAERAQDRLRSLTNAALPDDLFDDLRTETEQSGYANIDVTRVSDPLLWCSTVSDWSSYGYAFDPLQGEVLPQVKRYHSPLGLADALILAGLLSAFELAFLLLVLGPISVAVVQAQEVHENTLMPLANSALSPRQLALGLAAGALAPTLIVGTPLAGLMVAGALVDGSVFFGLATLLALVLGAAALGMGAQLLGHMMGRRRSAGVVAVFMVGLTGVAFFAGLSAGLSVGNQELELTALTPQSSFGILAGMTFGVCRASYADALQVLWILASAAGLCLLGGLALQVTQHKIAGHSRAPISRGLAIIGALTAILWLVGTIRFSASGSLGDFSPVLYVASLAALCPIFGAILMGRVSQTALPQHREVRLGRLVGEMLSWGGLHLLAVFAFAPFPLDILSPVAIIYAVYVLAVGGLVCIRFAAAPVGLPNAMALALSFPVLMMSGAHVMGWMVDPNLGFEYVLAGGKAGAGLGLMQLLVMIAVPVLVVRGIRKRTKPVTKAV